ncbi:hypothetical protein [Natrinema salaciae]|uniref:Uncharacterized protein n=1 Tax=Natrinema salaciae TaxID=1186196 RepID=A0A1H9F140_9EURY|nr:hypothetical protein [Natrinema salaciae]SEQ31672.1 hypothetical protein SAMN04489841_1439 [Natrinema salaciae]
MARSSTTQTEAEHRKRTKEVYEAVISAVDHNSGNKQPPLAKQSSVIQTLHGAGYGHFGLNELHKAITAARRNGDLFQATDDEDRTRLGIDDAKKLVEKNQTYFSRVEESRRREDVIGTANRRIQYLRGDDS